MIQEGNWQNNIVLTQNCCRNANYKTNQCPHERQYNVDADTINKIKELRAADPERWTLKEISKEFNIEMDKLHFFLRSQFQRNLQNLLKWCRKTIR